MERFHLFTFFNGAVIVMYKFVGKSEVYEMHLKSFIFGGGGCNHDITRFEVVEGSLGAVHDLHDVDELIGYFKDILHLCGPFHLFYVLFHVHLVEGHNIVRKFCALLFCLSRRVDVV